MNYKNNLNIGKYKMKLILKYPASALYTL